MFIYSFIDNGNDLDKMIDSETGGDLKTLLLELIKVWKGLSLSYVILA